MSNSTTFRLTTDKKEGTWSLRGGSAKKNGIAKFINYWPGSNSIFDEDNKESAVKPQSVVFRYNDIISDPGVEIIVPNENKVLIDYLMAHPFYGIWYKIHNQDQLDEEKSAGYDKVEEALSLIKETDDLKVQAITLAVIGIDAMGWTPAKCKATLKEKAVKESQFIIDQIKAVNYESKYLAALSIFSGIVTEDSFKSAVVWNDEQKGIILPLAKGENGITKLGEFLAVESDASNLVLQEIGARLNKNAGVASMKVENAQVVSPVGGKTEDQIKAEAIEAYKATLIPAKTEEQIIAEYLAKNQGAPETVTAPVVTETKDNAKTFDATDLVQVQEKYKEVTGKDAPVNKKNNLEWLNAEIVKGI